MRRERRTPTWHIHLLNLCLVDMCVIGVRVNIRTVDLSWCSSSQSAHGVETAWFKYRPYFRYSFPCMHVEYSKGAFYSLRERAAKAPISRTTELWQFTRSVVCGDVYMMPCGQAWAPKLDFALIFFKPWGVDLLFLSFPWDPANHAKYRTSNLGLWAPEGFHMMLRAHEGFCNLSKNAR